MRGDRIGRKAMLLVSSCLAIALLFGGCKRPEDDIGSADSPLVFVMSKSTTEGKAGEVEILRQTLEQESGLHIRIEIPPSPVRAIQLFRGRGADAGLLGPFEYLLAREIHGVEAGVQLQRDGRPTYQGTLLVKEDSEIESIEDLSGKRIAYTDPYSMTGFVLPAARLKRAGIEPDAIFAGTHDEAIEMVEDGRAHAAATYLRRAEGELEGRGLRILERTEPVPNEPVFFRKGLPEDKREAIVNAFIAATSDEQCADALTELLGCDSAAPVDDSAYDDIERIANEAGMEVQSLVPGGWTLHHEAQEPIVPTP